MIYPVTCRALLCLFVFILFSLSGCPARKERKEDPGDPEARSAKVEKSGEVSGAGKTTPGGFADALCEDPFALPPSGEGMWPWADLSKLDEDALQKRGLKLKLEDIWKSGEGGLAMAVVGLRGCTASFISKEGLLITNHHCVFRAIQRNSTKERNLLEDGFWAEKRGDELNGYGVRVLVFRNQRDVTDKINESLPDGGSDEDLFKAIEKKEKAIVAECEKKPDTRCLISRENDGLRFLLLESEEITDVRLVAAPPRSMGGYGGEIDNWQWPRHTLDFSLLRAYVGPKGKPREFHEDNVPYRPERFLKVSRKGVRRGDFVMVMGRPYHTDRYLSSEAIKQSVEWFYPTRLRLFQAWIDVLKQTAKDFQDAEIPTSSMIKGLQNGLKNAQGMIDGAKERNLLEEKRAEEMRWRAWVKAEPQRKKKWGDALDKLLSYRRKQKKNRERRFLLRYLHRGVNTLEFAKVLTKWAEEQDKPDLQREAGYQERDRDDKVSWLRNAQRSFHLAADKRVFALFLTLFGELPGEQRVKVFDKALGGDYSEKNIQRYVDRLYSNTKLYELEKRMEWFGKSRKELQNTGDAMLLLASQLAEVWNEQEKKAKANKGGLFRLRRPYLESLIRFGGKRFYPDANASPRVSFAHVAGYSPRDGEWHIPFTTLSGLLAKNTGKKPFDGPKEVLQKARVAAQTDYSTTVPGSQERDVPACFLSNADTTGGNSGSPAMNGKGEFVGLNFDRVYANITGDFGYSRKRSRNIMVDVRYILWYLDEVIGAEPLMKELFPGGREKKVSKKR